jgi:Ca-activated chloride channel homolog
MRWQLAEPTWLLLLALAIPHLLMARPRPLRLALRVAWLALVALALAEPSLQRRRAEVSVVALLDVSTSVADADLARAESLLGRLQQESRRRGSGARVQVARFAAVPVSPGPGRLPRPAGEESDLALALGWGLAQLPTDRVGRVLLVSDGRPTRGDLFAEVERARARGVRVFAHPLPDLPGQGQPPDVALASLTGPTTIRPGESFDLEARIVSNRPGSAVVRLVPEGERAGTPIERTVALDAGIGLLRFTTRLPTEAPTRYRLEIASATTNGERRNDSIALPVASRSRPRVLVVESTADSALPFRRALAAEQIEVRTAVGPTLPDLDRPDAPDLVVLSDLGTGLSASAALALERFVRERGGGLLVSGGPEGSAGGGPGRARFEAMLPLAYDTSEQKEEATLALGLIIDRSGSMSGPKMDLTKEAARGAAELMNPQDLITVVTFDSQAQMVVRLQPASNRQRILSDIAQIRASGGTNVLPGLQEAFDQLLAARARKKHAIVLSDGQSPAEGVRELVDEAATAGITVSAVGVGDGADLALLQTIAGRGGGRFYHTRDPASIPRIFTREASQLTPSNLVETPSRVRTTRAAQATAGIPFASAPPLAGHARSRARRGAEILLVTGRRDPLLARWQLGLGQVMVWTSDLSSRWSGEWVRWSSWNKLWGQVVRSALPGHADRALPMSVALQGDRALVQIRAFDLEDRPLVGLDGALAVTDVPERGEVPAGRTRSLPLVAAGAGVYQALVPLRGSAGLLLSAELQGDSAAGPVRLAAQGRLAIPQLRERLPPGAELAADALTGRALLSAAAARTGGSLIVSDLSPLLDPGSDRAVAWWPLRQGLLGAALALFLAEIAARRANFRRPDRRRGLAPPTRFG